jgi:ELWxxDGT repeat protein
MRALAALLALAAALSTVSSATVTYRTELVKDLVPGADWGMPGSLTPVGATLFFAANDDRLWKSDGTTAGTTAVANVRPYDLTRVGNTLFFTGGDGELWRSDGTADGTAVVRDFGPNYPRQLTAVGDTLYFAADDGVHGYELWRSDGSLAGTTMVADIDPGAASSIAHDVYDHDFVDVGGTLFFMADGRLWKSDGTGTGTVAVEADGASHAGPAHAKPSTNMRCVGTWCYHAVIGGTLFYVGYDAEHGQELWRSDGTPAGTALVRDVAPGPAGGAPQNLTVVGDTLFFTADDGVHGAELWKTNGSTAGTALVADIDPGAAGSYPDRLTAAGGTLFFHLCDWQHNAQLWRSDGTPAGTRLVKSMNADSADDEPYDLTDFAGTLYFSVSDGSHGKELWRSDGTEAGTAMVADINPGAASASPMRLTAYNGALFFSADDGVHGPELWKATAAGVAAPTIESFSPSSGPAGTTVRVSGNGLVGATTVKLSGSSVGFDVASATSLTFVVPGAATTGTIAVTTPAGTATSSAAFVVVVAPAITGFSPAEGAVHATVRVSGSHLTGTTRVRLGAMSVPFAVASDRLVTFTVPPGAADGPISVTNAAGSATTVGSFHLLAAPSIASFSPTSGPVGTPVTITGSNLAQVVGVRLGSVVTVPTVRTDSEVVFAVPPGASSGRITLLAPGGAVTSIGSFTVGS